MASQSVKKKNCYIQIFVFSLSRQLIKLNPMNFTVDEQRRRLTTCVVNVGLRQQFLTSVITGIHAHISQFAFPQLAYNH